MNSFVYLKLINIEMSNALHLFGKVDVLNFTSEKQIDVDSMLIRYGLIRS